MNASKFDQIVKARAQQRIEARVNKFRADIAAAFNDLFKGTPYQDSPFANPSYSRSEIKGQYLSSKNAKTVLDSLFYDDAGQPKRMILPLSFWESEESEVSKQLLATMDEMQKALCAPTLTDKTVIPPQVEQGTAST